MGIGCSCLLVPLKVPTNPETLPRQPILPVDTARDPGGAVLHSPGVEARSAEDPGSPAVRLIYTNPIGCRSSDDHHSERRPIGVEGRGLGYAFPGSSGLCPSDHRATKDAPLAGCILTSLRHLLSRPSARPPEWAQILLPILVISNIGIRFL